MFLAIKNYVRHSKKKKKHYAARLVGQSDVSTRIFFRAQWPSVFPQRVCRFWFRERATFYSRTKKKKGLFFLASREGFLNQ